MTALHRGRARLLAGKREGTKESRLDIGIDTIIDTIMVYRRGVQPSRNLPAPPPPPHVSRWRIIKDLVSFQIKLTLEGLKDILLVPLSLAAAALGLLVSGPDRGRHLRNVMRLGRGYDEWIQLYSALDRDPDAKRERDQGAPAPGQDTNLDAYLGRLQRALAKHSRQGRLPTRARVAIERAIDVLDTPDAPPQDNASRSNPENAR